jgi:hypothetical protein
LLCWAHMPLTRRCLAWATLLGWSASLGACGSTSHVGTEGAAAAPPDTGGTTASSSDNTASGGKAASGAAAGALAQGGQSGAGGGAQQANGGNQSAGSPGALPNGSCRSSADCSVVTGPTVSGGRCLSPDTPTPPTPCGMLNWCGQCNCPPLPEAPTGTGQACQTRSDCPATSGGTKVASLCDNGLCTECAQDSDCGGDTPVCGSVQGELFRSCSQCREDTDCSGATPYCALETGLGRCVACVTSAQCTQGVCESGSCIPECDDARPCPSPFDVCTAELGCGPRSCTASGACAMPNSACVGSRCVRRACQADSECDSGGSCVNGACYEMWGRCFIDQKVP